MQLTCVHTALLLPPPGRQAAQPAPLPSGCLAAQWKRPAKRRWRPGRAGRPSAPAAAPAAAPRAATDKRKGHCGIGWLRTHAPGGGRPAGHAARRQGSRRRLVAARAAVVATARAALNGSAVAAHHAAWERLIAVRPIHMVLRLVLRLCDRLAGRRSRRALRTVGSEQPQEPALQPHPQQLTASRSFRCSGPMDLPQ